MFFYKSIVFFKEKYYFHRFPDHNGLSQATNFNSIKSCLYVIKGLLFLSKLKEISKQKKIYCKQRIEKLLTDLYPLLFLTSKKNLIKLSRYIHKNLNLFLLLKKYKHKIFDDLIMQIQMNSTNFCSMCFAQVYFPF